MVDAPIPTMTFGSGGSYVIPRFIPAIILYPSLLTPEIIVGNDESEYIQLLILVHNAITLTAANVNHQLKITPNLDPAKSFSFQPLFATDEENYIRFVHIGFNREIIATNSKFKGIIDQRAFDLFDGAGYNKLYNVNVSNSFMRSRGLYNLFWLWPFDGVWHPLPAEEAVASGGAITYTLNRVESGKITSNEIQDELMRGVLREMNGSRIPENGTYCFPLGDRDIDHRFANLANPIQAYHPVVFFDSSVEYLGLGHVTDLHISARQNALAKSTARVIDFPFENIVTEPTPPVPPAPASSPGSTPSSAPEPPPLYDIYTVVSGDWLSKIAARYGMTWPQLWHYDGGTGIPNSSRLRSGDPDLIYPGEEIVVPHTGPAPPEEAQPTITVSTSSLTFVATESGGNPDSQSLEVTNTGGGTLTWTLEVSAPNPQISVDSISGSAPSTLNVTVAVNGLTRGTYSGAITVSSTDATNSPVVVPVTLIISLPLIAIEDSPELGQLINVTARNIKELFDRVGSDPTISAMVIGGDLIDFIKMLWPDGTATTVKQIWDQVALDDSYESRYQDYVDYISFYTLIVYFCNQYHKPVFVVTGNHDAYALPYGISPRVAWVRANPGIPADHNLTIYEAILTFGETYDEIKEMGTFHAERLKWFYSVLTPFSDYMIDLPRQTLVGLSWGEQEDMLDPPGIDQGFGHLPRADDPITDKQLELFRKGIANWKHLILTSHFTFVSYIENVPMNTTDEGDVEFSTYWNAGDNDQGTFETNREPLYDTYLGTQRSVQIVLTGHSHRRGFYTINRVDYAGDNSVKTSYYDYADLARLQSSENPVHPVVIVTDSAGPLPRCNKQGEFNGQGSDRAAGAKISFDSAGEIASIEPVTTTLKPRFAVAVDYYDLLENNPTIGHHDRVIASFESDRFLIRDEHRGLVDYKFEVRLLTHIARLIYVNDIAIYAFAADGEWKRIRLRYDGASRWVIDRGRDAEIFFNFIAGNNERSNFMSIKFSQKSDLVAQYDFDTRWNFEFQVDCDRSGGGLFGDYTHKKYILNRDVDRAEIPDFEWRRRFVKYQ